MHREITEDQARAVLEILRKECGYSADVRSGDSFVTSICWPNRYSAHVCREFRFCGALGFGGKFRNNDNRDAPYIDCYPEDETRERRAMMDRANARLAELFNGADQ